MGTVYRADDLLSGETVALKRVTAPGDHLRFASRGGANDAPAVRLALLREFRTLASLRHPHIVSVLDYGFDANGQPFFTMPLLHNARTLLEAGRGQDTREQVTLLIAVLHALNYLHRRELLHRDLKPENILVDHHGKVCLLDFGLSIDANQAGEMSGTLPYLPPEALRRETLTPASDLYSLGVIACQMFSGHHPYPMHSPARLMGAILRTAPDVSGIAPPELQAIVVRLLEKTPTARFASARQVITALAEAVGLPVQEEQGELRESFLQAAAFIGREEELAHLEGALARVRAGQPALWLVGGESGVGKSRLLDEIRVRALVEGVSVIRASASPGADIPYALWRAVLARLALSTPLSDPEAGVLYEIVPEIAGIVGRAVTPAATLTGDSARQRLALTIAAVLRRQTQPLLLILEDLHWADHSAFAPLIDIFGGGHADAPPLLVIGTFRSEDTPDLPDRLPHDGLLHLHRLDAVQIARLSRSMLGSAGETGEVVDLLVRETEGNLFFLVETVRALAEEAGSLDQVGRVTLPGHVLTGGMIQVVRRRLSRVSPHFARLQMLAALTGRAIDTAVLRHLLSDEQVDDWLNEAVNAAVIEWVDEQWRFAHDKLRETLLIDLPDAERPAHHRQIAQAIETLYPNNPAHHFALLEHWHSADDLDKEVIYLRHVAKRKMEIDGDAQGTRTLVERALPRLTADDPRRPALLNWLAKTALRAGEYDQTIALAHEARTRAQECSEEREWGLSYNIEGIAWNYRGDYPRAIDAFTTGLPIARRAESTIDIVSMLANLGVLLYFSGDPDQAEGYLIEALALTETIDDPALLAMTRAQVGGLYMIQGRFDEALDQYARSAQISEAIGYSAGSALSHAAQSALTLMRGDAHAARDHALQALSIYRRLRHRWGITETLVQVGTVELQIDPQRAIPPLIEALSEAVAIGADALALQALLCLALLHVREKRYDQAAAWAKLAATHLARDSEVEARLLLIDQGLKEALGEVETQQVIDRAPTLSLEDAARAALLYFAPQVDAQ